MPEIDSDSDSIIHLRVSVARMEGMLSQALTDQSTRLTKVEADQVSIHGRLSEKGKLLATHSEQIKHNANRIHDLEEARDTSVARVVAVVGAVIAGLSVLIQFIPFPGVTH